MAVNTGYTEVTGSTTGNYNMNYVRTWMEYKVLDHTASDVSANQTRIDVKLYSQVQQGGSSSGMAYGDAQQYGHAGYDGTNYADYTTAYNFNNFALNCFFDGVLTIPHNADGTRSVTLQASFTTISTTISGGSVTTGQIVLPDFPRATTISNIMYLNYGYNTQVTLSRQANTLTDEVIVSDGVGTVKATSSTATTFTFSIDRSKAPNIAYPSAKSFTLTVKTYNGAVLVGTNTYTYSWQINPDDIGNWKPTFTAPTAAAYNDVIPELNTTAVKGYSKIRVTAAPSAITCKYGATVASRVVAFDNGQSISSLTANPVTSNIITTSGTHTWSYTITDSRGFTQSASGTISFGSTINLGTTLTSVSNRYYNKQATFELSRKASTLREKVTVSKTGYSQVAKNTDNGATNFVFTIPYAFNGTELVPNIAFPSASMITITIETYSGSTKIATNTYTQSWQLSADSKADFEPTFTTPTSSPLNELYPSLDTSPKTAVAKYSKIRVVASPSSVSYKHGASVASRVVTFDVGWSDDGNSKTNFDSCIIDSAGRHTWTYTVTDSRGLSKSVSGYVDVIGYTAPRLSVLECYRGLSDQSASDSGTYVWATVTYDRDTLNGHNAISYKKGQVGTMTAVELQNNTRIMLCSNAVSTNTYAVTFTVRDLLDETIVRADIPAEYVDFSIREGGHGTGIGALATEEGILRVGYPIKSIDYIQSKLDSSESYAKLTNGGTVETYAQTGSGGNRTESKTYVGGQALQANHKVYVGGTMTEQYNSEQQAGSATYTESVSGVTKKAVINPNGLWVYDGADQLRTQVLRTSVLIDDRTLFTCNRIDNALTLQGNINDDGTYGTDTNRCRSWFAPVEANTKYTISKPSGIMIYAICFYTSSRSFSRKTTIGANMNYTFTTQGSDAYVRFVLAKTVSADTIVPSDIGFLQLEKGSAASDTMMFTMDGKDIADRLRAREWYATKQITTSTSLADTGCSITIPKKGWYLIHGQGVANNSGVSQIAVYCDYSASSRSQLASQTSLGSLARLTATFCGYIEWDNVPITVWAKYGGATTNNIYLWVKQLYTESYT